MMPIYVQAEGEAEKVPGSEEKAPAPAATVAESATQPMEVQAVASSAVQPAVVEQPVQLEAAVQESVPQVAQPVAVAQSAQPEAAVQESVPQAAQPVAAAQSAQPEAAVQESVPQATQPVVTEQVALPAAVPTPAVATPTPAEPTAASAAEGNVPAVSIPSGVVEIGGLKYPAYLYVPRDYKMDRTYSMILIGPAESVKAQDQVAYLTGLAQRKSLFILSPHVLWTKPGDTPYELDRWILEIKKDVMERFPINKKRVYLVGKGSGAHYAAYLATKHPKEFAAVALFGEAWDGPFRQLIKPSSDPAEQVPFFIALKAGSDAQVRNQSWFDKLQKKGYMLHLVEYPTDETLNDLEFKKTTFDWLEEASQNWAATVAKSHQGWKGKFRKGVKDFFTV